MKMCIDGQKEAAAKYAVDKFIHSGMKIGLGTGSTTRYAIDYLGEKLKKKLVTDVFCIPSSTSTQALMEKWGIPETTLDNHYDLDVVIDGADEVDAQHNLVKGRGMALLREKMLALCGRTLVIMVDDSKLVKDNQGLRGPIPVEIVQFGASHVLRRLLAVPLLRELGVTGCLRAYQNKLVETDNGHYIADLYFPHSIKDPERVAQSLSATAGVVEHGLFLGMNPVIVVAHKNGDVQTISQENHTV